MCHDSFLSISLPILEPAKTSDVYHRYAQQYRRVFWTFPGTYCPIFSSDTVEDSLLAATLNAIIPLSALIASMV